MCSNTFYSNRERSRSTIIESKRTYLRFSLLSFLSQKSLLYGCICINISCSEKEKDINIHIQYKYKALCVKKWEFQASEFIFAPFVLYKTQLILL